MAGGQHWSWGIHGVPFDTFNMGRNGYRTDQLVAATKNACAMGPKTILHNGGTNDVIAGYSESETVANTNSNLQVILDAGIRPLLTLEHF